MANKKYNELQESLIHAPKNCDNFSKPYYLMILLPC